MRKWGALVTLFYALVVLLLIVPGAVWIAKGEVLVIYKQWITWFPIVIVIAGQALLLFSPWTRLSSGSSLEPTFWSPAWSPGPCGRCSRALPFSLWGLESMAIALVAGFLTNMPWLVGARSGPFGW